MISLIGIDFKLYLLLIISSNLVWSLDITCRNKFGETVAVSEPACFITQQIFLDAGEKLSFVNAGDTNNVIRIVFHEDYIRNNTNIYSIPRELFTTFEKLSDLSLKTNIRTVSREDFLNAHNLEYLTLGNLLESIPAGVFPEAKNLNTLTLRDNKITKIEDNAFSGLEKLYLLELSNNKLTKLNRLTFAGLPNLYYLHISNNNIEVIEEGTFNLPNLKNIILRFNKLKSVSDTIFSGVPLLESVSLEYNNLDSIGKSLHGLNKLDIAFLNNNKIRKIDLEALSQLPSLRILFLSDNSLEWDNETSLESYQSSNSQLTRLEISGNKLLNKDTLKRIAIFRQLIILNIQNNEFVTLDYQSKPLKEVFPNLNEISLGQNKWECKWLEGFIAQLKRENIDIITSLSQETSNQNIENIGCF